MSLVEIYDMRGRAITQHFFDELEKIAVANPFKVIARPMQLRAERQAIEAALGGTSYLSKATPWMPTRAQFGIRIPGTYGLGTKEYRMANAARVREAASVARANRQLKRRASQALRTGTQSPLGAERAAALEYIQEANAARAALNQADKGSVRQRLQSFIGSTPASVEPQRQGLSLPAKAALGLGGAGLAAGGGLYAYNRMNQGQGGYGGGY